MQQQLRPRASTLPAIFSSFVLFSSSAALITYINSSFIEQFVSARNVGLLFSAGACVSLGILFSAPWILKKISAYALSIILLALELLSLLVLTFGASPAIILIFFVVYRGVVSSLMYVFDLFLEEGSKTESQTGRIRGLYLGLSNITFIIAPTITGFLLGADNFSRVYLISSLFIIPILLLVTYKLRPVSKNITAPKNFWGAFSYIKNHKDLRHIITARFLLQFFYAWMVIYTPVYLIQHLGFSWQEIGIIFTIMLLPFAIFQIPAGYLADKKYGEKEILVIGFTIMGMSTFAISQIATQSFILLAGILFMTRVGASLVEIMTESYFFKHVNEDDSDLISVFRATSPLSYLIGPLLGSLALFFVPFPAIFAILGICMFWGIHCALSIQDTL